MNFKKEFAALKQRKGDLKKFAKEIAIKASKNLNFRDIEKGFRLIEDDFYDAQEVNTLYEYTIYKALIESSCRIYHRENYFHKINPNYWSWIGKKSFKK